MSRSLIYLLFILPSILAGQTTETKRVNDLRLAEDTLNAVLSAINATGSDSTRDLLNQRFSKILEGALRLPDVGPGSFSSLKTLVQVGSPDRHFQLFHWNLPDTRGEHRYFGFIRVTGDAGPIVIRLTDMARTLAFPDSLLLDQDHWFGALYYKVIENQGPGDEKVYTLLGWSGKDKGLTQKVIEVLTFDSSGTVRFGKRIFPDYSNGTLTRIIFRFSSAASMSLKYEWQPVVTAKHWNQKNQSFDYTYREKEMIVCDRMVPMDPQLEGQYRFYVTAGDTWDGFLYSDHAWHFVRGIDPRNKK
jgi:hypothetical protein